MDVGYFVVHACFVCGLFVCWFYLDLACLVLFVSFRDSLICALILRFG